MSFFKSLVDIADGGSTEGKSASGGKKAGALVLFGAVGYGALSFFGGRKRKKARDAQRARVAKVREAKRQRRIQRMRVDFDQHGDALRDNVLGQAEFLDYDTSGIKDIDVQRVQGKHLTKDYMEQHEIDRLQFQEAAYEAVSQELETQSQEINVALARGDITSREQLETGTLKAQAQRNFQDAVRRGQRIGQIGAAALDAANRRAYAQEAAHRQQMENQKRGQRSQTWGLVGSVVGAGVGAYVGGPAGAKVGWSLGGEVGSTGGAAWGGSEDT